MSGSSSWMSYGSQGVKGFDDDDDYDDDYVKSAVNIQMVFFPLAQYC